MNDNFKFWVGFVTFVVLMILGLQAHGLIQEIMFLIAIVAITYAFYFEGKRRIKILVQFLKNLVGK